MTQSSSVSLVSRFEKMQARQATKEKRRESLLAARLAPAGSHKESRARRDTMEARMESKPEEKDHDALLVEVWEKINENRELIAGIGGSPRGGGNAVAVAKKRRQQPWAPGTTAHRVKSDGEKHRGHDDRSPVRIAEIDPSTTWKKGNSLSRMKPSTEEDGDEGMFAPALEDNTGRKRRIDNPIETRTSMHSSGTQTRSTRQVERKVHASEGKSNSSRGPSPTNMSTISKVTATIAIQTDESGMGNSGADMNEISSADQSYPSTARASAATSPVCFQEPRHEAAVLTRATTPGEISASVPKLDMDELDKHVQRFSRNDMRRPDSGLSSSCDELSSSTPAMPSAAERRTPSPPVVAAVKPALPSRTNLTLPKKEESSPKSLGDVLKAQYVPSGAMTARNTSRSKDDNMTADIGGGRFAANQLRRTPPKRTVVTGLQTARAPAPRRSGAPQPSTSLDEDGIRRSMGSHNPKSKSGKHSAAGKGFQKVISSVREEPSMSKVAHPPVAANAGSRLPSPWDHGLDRAGISRRSKRPDSVTVVSDLGLDQSPPRPADAPSMHAPATTTEALKAEDRYLAPRKKNTAAYEVCYESGGDDDDGPVEQPAASLPIEQAKPQKQAPTSIRAPVAPSGMHVTKPKPEAERNDGAAAVLKAPPVPQPKTNDRSNMEATAPPSFFTRLATPPVACAHCFRSFHPARLEVHERNCANVFQSRRPTFDSLSMRWKNTPVYYDIESAKREFGMKARRRRARKGCDDKKVPG